MNFKEEMNMKTLWIARDKSGLYLFRNKPEPDKGNNEYWDTPYWGCMPINMNLFPELTRENSPQQIELQLKEENG